MLSCTAITSTSVVARVDAIAAPVSLSLSWVSATALPVVSTSLPKLMPARESSSATSAVPVSANVVVPAPKGRVIEVAMVVLLETGSDHEVEALGQLAQAQRQRAPAG